MRVRTVLFCPFTAGTMLWQAQGGAYTLSVCVRGTFSLVHGREAVLADAQEPVQGDRHAGDDPGGSLYAPSDLVPYKPRVDVVLVGSAFAPDQEPVEALVARVALGSLEKSLGVIGDRVWVEGPDGPEPSPPRPFRSMPIAYERAARARDNPHGFDLARTPALGALALPNLETMDDGVARTPNFGPIAMTAPSRRSLLRPEGWAWVEGGARGPVPPGFDFAFYNAAPRDQQLESLRAGETLVLENLDRARPRLETRLPSVRPRAFVVPNEVERGFEIALRCDTVWIDTDRGILTLSWRGLSTVDTADEEAIGTVVVAAESTGREVGYAQIAKLVRDGGMTSTDSDTFGEARSIAPKGVGAAELDPDLVPTLGPFRAKRPLPEVGAGPSAAPKVGAAAPVPVLIQDDPSTRPTWDEITASELAEPLSTEDLKTLTRIDARTFSEEPSTKPLLKSPPDAAALGAADYARIAVAVERGDAARTLFEYGRALPDLPRLEREWSAKSAADPAFAEAFADALAEARRR